MAIARFAPSTTGAAHPGTLLSGLLVWLDARAGGHRVVLRLEDLDHTRSTPSLRDAMVRDLEWFGLDWDERVTQSERMVAHASALDRLAAAGLLYACGCSRSDRRAGGRRGPDGGYVYDNRCRGRGLPADGWRSAGATVRCRLPDVAVDLVDEGGTDLSQRPAEALGDPIVVRRDGVVAYPLVVVVDDAASGVTRIVRGRDLAAATATQVALHRLLELEVPTYRHHFLLLEPGAGKMAKLHGSIGLEALRERYSAPALAGFLAKAAGLIDVERPIAPAELVADFEWGRVRDDDVVVRCERGVLRTEEP